jgi:trigger factor
LKITTEPLANRQLRLTIEVDDERTQQAMRRTARQIAKQANFPGFRKGKAPYELVVQRYGEETIRQEAADALIEEVYREALEQEGIEPFDAAVLEKTELDPITFNFTIPLRATVDLGNYRNYRLKPRKVKVRRREVRQALEQLREQNAILELVERPAALGDSVVIDLVGRTAQGTEILKADQARIKLEAKSADPAPGFAAAVAGTEAGEERTFTLDLPDDFPREELRGQEAEFTVKVTEVYDSTLPKLDADLARTVGNFDSLKELAQQIKEQLHQVAQQEADEEYAEQVLEDMLQRAQVEYPPMMLEEALGEAVKDVERVVKRKARLSLEDYLRFQGKNMEELREELEPDAAARLKRALVLGEVVRLERLDVDQEEISAQIEEISAPWGIRADEVRTSLSSGEGQQTVRSHLLGSKAVQRLVAIARGEAPKDVSGEEQEIGEAEEEGK